MMLPLGWGGSGTGIKALLKYHKLSHQLGTRTSKLNAGRKQFAFGSYL